MSRKNRFKGWTPPQASALGTALGAAPATDVPPKDRAQVEQLIANGKLGFATEIAKQVHKRLGSAASEGLLVEAYAARISSLAERNLDIEARALLEQVEQRHPTFRDRLREVAANLEARRGGVEGLLGLLADTSLTAEKRADIEARIRAAAGDPARIARCEALPPEHPLRVAAAALAAALDAVARGPVAAESVALPEISRQSPLAPWKMLIRAIQAFYGNEDALCEKYLAAVEPSSAAARLVPAVRAMMGQKQTLTPTADALVRQAGGVSMALRAALAGVDQAFDRKNNGLAFQEMSKAVGICREARPDLLERLKQHISVKAMLAGAKVDRVTAALGGPSLKNACFWRLLARAYEESPAALSIPLACSVWEEFRRHAVHEGWFPAKGPEVATLYLHMADLWKRIPDEEMGPLTYKFAVTFPGHKEYYAGQPPEIRALMPAPNRRDEFYYLSPDPLFERACAADPCAENFQRWLNWTTQHETGREDYVAGQWAAALPKDIPPVLHLMQSAEKTNALKRAFKLMEQAESLDGLNPDVRKARLRLLISLATRHLQQKKIHLAEPELRQMEALPQAQQGDRPALLAALRWVYWTLGGDATQAAAARASVVGLLGGETAAHILLMAVAGACKLKQELATPKSKGAPLAAGVGRACALSEDAGWRVEIPRGLSNALVRELSGGGAVTDATGLGALGEAALRTDDYQLAWAVSEAGLSLSQERWAEFLFLRARTFPGWDEERQALCAAAASELARRQRNADLLRRIGEWREEEMMGFDGGQIEVTMSTEQIDQLIKRERESDFPDMTEAGGLCDCPSCRAEREGLPPGLDRMVEELGPDVVMQALEEIIGGGLGKRKKRRSRGREDEIEGGTDYLPF